MALQFIVSDTGIGLSAAAQTRIFSEFEQADASPIRRHGGTGLGLAISKRLATAMRGGISVASTLGQGSVFKAEIELGYDENNPAPARRGALLNSGKRVLVVSERHFEGEALAETLETAGQTVAISAARVLEARLVAAAVRPTNLDVLIADGGLGPELTGRILTSLRAATTGQPLRGIVVIDASERPRLEEFRQAGYDAYLVRPVRPHSLLLQIEGPGLVAVGAGVATTQLVGAPIKELLNPGDAPDACTQEAAASGVITERLIQSSSRAPRRVLLAEDNDINALLARRILENAGCTVVQVGNGREAVEAIHTGFADRSRQFDLVLMDQHMPELDGLDATRIIKALFGARPGSRAGTEAPPIIAMTANAFAEDRLRCLQAGMDDYLAKPFDRAELEALLEKWFLQGAADRHGTFVSASHGAA